MVKGRNIIYTLNSGETVADWCKRENVPYSSVTIQLNKGYMVDEACNLAKEAHIKHLNRKVLMYKGKTLRSMVSGGAYTSIKRKMKLTGCDIETALKIYEHNKKRQGYITIHNIHKRNELV